VTGEYTFAIFAVTTAALVISWLVSVYFVPYLGACCCNEGRGRGARGELFDTPFYTASARRELVRAAPLDHHRPDAG
jgi:multidrug efflux pump